MGRSDRNLSVKLFSECIARLPEVTLSGLTEVLYLMSEVDRDGCLALLTETMEPSFPTFAIVS
ncbi:MAG: hypothetical protein HYU64_09350 [Armatimonadetes bacterium]|nr:hypothetical protein [Armatimonadota bacterium]